MDGVIAVWLKPRTALPLTIEGIVREVIDVHALLCGSTVGAERAHSSTQHTAQGHHPGRLLLLRLPRVRLSPVPPHIGQGPSETGKGARRSLAVLRPNTPPL